MGGGALGGNVTVAAEFNVFADPEAAAIVFTAECPVRMCGLDLTHQVTGNQALVDRLTEVGGPAATLVAEIVSTELAAFGRYATSSPEPPLHDPVALLAVTHPHLFEEIPTPIHVETADGLSRGTTHVDRRLVTAQGTRPTDAGHRTTWVHTVDGAAALDLHRGRPPPLGLTVLPRNRFGRLRCGSRYGRRCDDHRGFDRCPPRRAEPAARRTGRALRGLRRATVGRTFAGSESWWPPRPTPGADAPERRHRPGRRPRLRRPRLLRLGDRHAQPRRAGRRRACSAPTSTSRPCARPPGRRCSPA